MSKTPEGEGPQDTSEPSLGSLTEDLDPAALAGILYGGATSNHEFFQNFVIGSVFGTAHAGEAEKRKLAEALAILIKGNKSQREVGMKFYAIYFDESRRAQEK